MSNYDPAQIENKWQQRWEETGASRARLAEEDGRPPCYCLVMFSYPSGDKLHLGHWFNFGPTDTWARYRRMCGDHVFEPMGFDSFGLPAENFAIKSNVHPRAHTEKNIKFMQGQLREIGAMYDWDHEVQTHTPEYYKWTQWLFLELYNGGYAYRGKAPVNWCDHCQTVLANEQVHAGVCERCQNPVRQRELTQWFFRITDFADELLEGLDRIDWPHKTVAMQRNWIGRSEGAFIDFSVDVETVEGDDEIDPELRVFTTRPDTVFGVTYMVLAPEHPLVPMITSAAQRQEVDRYREHTATMKAIDRESTARDKTGVFTGAYAMNPVNGDRIPIWIADYVLAGYGTGAVMAVPGHDQRDFEFAQHFDLPIRRVILGAGGEANEPSDEAWTQDGQMCNSGEFDGLEGAVARERMIEYLEQWGYGEGAVNYRLRDWLISRQRYWGAPIPIIHCDACGEVAVPFEDLPVRLPEDVEFQPTGRSPLADHPWRDVKCPQCSGNGRREPDTMDTFVDSSWYFLRYVSPHRDDVPWDRKLIHRWLPVAQYVGGAEHATMHLLYARFVIKALQKLGHVDFDEPFARLVHQGVITKDGAKMSKSHGNVVSPEEFVKRYGSDVLRAYLMFGFAYTLGGDWESTGIDGIARYFKRVFRFLVENAAELGEGDLGTPEAGSDFDELNFTHHNSIKGATQDLDRFQFNTALSRHMELTNALLAYAHVTPVDQWGPKARAAIRDWVLILAPFAPHLGEELWERLGGEGSVFDQSWPIWDEAALRRDQVTVVIQVNGKLRDEMEVARGIQREALAEMAQGHGRIPHWIGDKAVRKVIVVPDKLVNIVVG